MAGRPGAPGNPGTPGRSGDKGPRGINTTYITCMLMESTGKVNL